VTTQTSRTTQREILPDTGLIALVPIETVDEAIEGGIIARPICRGPLSEDEEFMSRRVQWANRATFTVLDCEVPGSFAPYNAVIRISAAGTEDIHLDYLAVLTR
jgi:hypothetical protein